MTRPLWSTIEAAFGVPSIDPVVHKLLQFQSDQFGASAGGYCSQPSREIRETAAFVVSKPGKYTEDQFTANWDREFRGGNDKLSARFFFSNGEQLLPFGAGGCRPHSAARWPAASAHRDLNFPRHRR